MDNKVLVLKILEELDKYDFDYFDCTEALDEGKHIKVQGSIKGCGQLSFYRPYWLELGDNVKLAVKSLYKSVKCRADKF